MIIASSGRLARNRSCAALALLTVLCSGLPVHAQAKPPQDKAASGKAAPATPADKATADKATADKATADKATADKATAGKATAGKATTDKATADKATADKATADKAQGAAASGATGAETADAKPEPPSPEVVKRAGNHFERGLQLYNDAEYRLALIEFERAYQLVPNYRVQYNIAQVSIQIGRYARAVHALEHYLEQGGTEISPERRAQVETDLKMLAGRTARVNITSNVAGAEILLDETPVALIPMKEKLLIDAGEHRLTVRARNYQPRTEQLTFAGGDDVEYKFDLTVVKKEAPVVIVKEVEKDQQPIVEEEEFPYVTVGWVTTGVLAAGAVTAGVIGLSAKNKVDDLAEPDPDQCEANGCEDEIVAERDKQKKQAQNWFLASDIMTGAAVVAGAVSLYLTIVGSESSPADTKVVGKGFSLRPGAGLNSVWVEGSF